VFSSSERKRLYKEARTFLKLRSQRQRWVQEQRAKPGPVAPAPGESQPEEAEAVEPANA